MQYQSDNVGRALRVLACLLACGLAGAGGARVANAQAPVPTPLKWSAIGQADVAEAIADFKAHLGGADNGSAVGSQPTGFRQLTWDDVPDNLADPNELPVNYYTATRGAQVYPGGYLPSLKVSASASNPTSTPILFGQSALFTAYSPQRVMRATFAGGVGFRVAFKVPGAGNLASVSGFGAVFTDVNFMNRTGFTVYDEDFRSLGTFYAPQGPGHNTVSFLGVIFPSPTRIYYVAVYTGTDTWTEDDDTHDLVATDDLIFGEPQRVTPPVITITSPTTAPTVAGTGPFISLAGTKSHAPSQVTWSNNHGDNGVAEGNLEWVIHDIPLRPGPNVITVSASNEDGEFGSQTLAVNSDVFSYYLAEGSTGGFFDTDLAIANPNATAAPITLKFLREDGTQVVQHDTLDAMTRKTYHADSIPGVEATAFSTIVTSENRLPLMVERSMFWDKSYYGGKGAKAIDQPSNTWYFAEGVQNSFFSTFVLLENPNAQAVDAKLAFTLQFGEGIVDFIVPLPPLSRVTIDTGSILPLVGRSFGLTVTAGQPIIAERATYFETTPTQLWAGGHGSPGVPVPSVNWLFAEGATGDFRDTFILLSNPHGVPAPVHASFTTSGGTSFLYGDTVPANGRLTIPIKDITINGAHPLANAEFSMSVGSDLPIVAERAMYWHGAPGPWADGTSAFGLNTVGLRWGFAEGRVGGPLTYHTYIRIASIGGILQPADVRVTFLKADGTTLIKNYAIADNEFVTIDVNAIPELQDQSFGTLIESMNGINIYTERSMYWDSQGVFWAGGLATSGTRLP